MKMKAIILLLFTLLGVASCITDHPSPQVLKVSEDLLRFSGNGGAWRLTINSNCDWQITGGDSWCTPDTTAGSKTMDILVSVDTNDTHSERSTSLTFTCEQKQVDIHIYQDTTGNNYYYELPVIFHLFYAEPTDSLQNASQEIFNRMIEECNRLYNTSTNSVAMNLKLVAATEDPQGNPLAEPGIERTLKTPSAVMSCESFMSESNTEYSSFLWDLNKYINVFVYTFTETSTAGISHLPYTPRENSLVGLQANNYYFSNQPTYPHCISINNTYITQEDAYITLAHELGHYLGLFHVFSENGCDESDYCDDTPNYNRNTYLEWLQTLTPPYNFQEVIQRTSCDGEASYISTNIMDYYYSYQDRFTAQQYSRVRHVLENSPLIPGPKNIATTKAAPDDIIPEVRAIR